MNINFWKQIYCSTGTIRSAAGERMQPVSELDRCFVETQPVGLNTFVRI